MKPIKDLRVQEVIRATRVYWVSKGRRTHRDLRVQEDYRVQLLLDTKDLSVYRVTKG